MTWWTTWWEEWEDVLMLIILNGSLLGLFTALWVYGKIEDYIKFKFLKPIVYIILVPISGSIAFVLFVAPAFVWFIVLLPLILLMG